MSTATDGRRREHAIRNHMALAGWRQVMRSAGSKGSADLLMVHPIHGAALVQVGSQSKRLGPTERARLIADATDTGALAILAIWTPRQPPRYWQITNGQPKTWPEWHP